MSKITQADEAYQRFAEEAALEERAKIVAWLHLLDKDQDWLEASWIAHKIKTGVHLL